MPAHSIEPDVKLELLRAAVTEAIDSMDRGEGLQFESMDQVDAHIDQIAAEVSATLVLERRRG